MSALLFPKVSRFDSLFTLGSFRRTCPTEEFNANTGQWYKGKSTIGDYMAVSTPDAFKSLQVVPSAQVIEAIESNMLLIDRDRISFRATYRDDGTVLLSANSGLILASRWLAVVGPNTMPMPEVSS